jgi:tetratricopeptide (TPR) repeat protein
MLTDNEIRRITEDTLEFEAFAQTLKGIITTPETPITIGVYGAWGSGKTSLMRMTQDLLKDGDKIKTVWFDAWKFDKTYDLRVALIHAILRRMKEDERASKRLKDKVGKLLKRVNWLGLGKAALSSFLPPLAMLQGKEPLLKTQGKISGKTLELIGDFEEEFKQLIKDYVGDEGRMVVFIDDLDRCISEKTIDILEAIKLFLNVPRSIFVIGADRKRIEEGIIEKYGKKSEGWAGNYLEKIVQIRFPLPPLRKGVLTEQFIPRLNVSPEIKKYAHILAEVGNNPRAIKRVLNSFEVKRILAEKKKLKVKGDILAKLTVIEFRWHEVYTNLIFLYSTAKENLAKTLKYLKAEREKKLKETFMTQGDTHEHENNKVFSYPREDIRKYSEDESLMKFLEQEPPLWNIDLDQYVYLARSTTELKESAVNYFNIAYSFGEKGDHIKAIENYDKAIEVNPNYEEAWYNKGNELSKLERHAEAIECYDKAIELNPNDDDAWYNKGNEFGKLERHGEAIACYDKAIELNHNYEKAWYNKGNELGELERHEEAIEYYDKAIELNPNYVLAWFNKGNVLGKLERHEEAIEYYDKAIELNPNYKEVWFNKGVILERLGRKDEAEQCFQKAKELGYKES